MGEGILISVKFGTEEYAIDSLSRGKFGRDQRWELGTGGHKFQTLTRMSAFFGPLGR